LSRPETAKNPEMEQKLVVFLVHPFFNPVQGGGHYGHEKGKNSDYSKIPGSAAVQHIFD
jgi:hypothetical protein